MQNEKLQRCALVCADINGVIPKSPIPPFIHAIATIYYKYDVIRFQPLAFVWAVGDTLSSPQEPLPSQPPDAPNAIPPVPVKEPPQNPPPDEVPPPDPKPLPPPPISPVDIS